MATNNSWTVMVVALVGACGDAGTSEGSTGEQPTMPMTATGDGPTTATGDGPTTSAGETADAPTTTTPTTVSTTDPGTGETSSVTDTTGATDTTGMVSTVSETGTETGSGTTEGPCEGAECCMVGQVFCAGLCCAEGEVCNFTQCEAPGADCEEADDCGDGQYCDYALGEGEVQPPDPKCMGGVVQPTGKCLMTPPLCGPNDPPQDPDDPDCLQSCTFAPAGGFSPSQKYAWGGVLQAPYDSDIMMTPIVIQLDDDDCDGQITERDIPEIVFATWANGEYKDDGTLHAISVEDGVLVDKWSTPTTYLSPTKHIAGGDIDGQPGNEIVACGEDGTAYAFNGDDGTLLWMRPTGRCMMPSLADLDGDGAVEVITEGKILVGATGADKVVFMPVLNSPPIVADIDGDGQQDILTSSKGYRADGTKFVDTGLAASGYDPGSPDWKGAWPGVADFDGDGKPEVVVIDNQTHTLLIWRYNDAAPNDFDLVRMPVDINAGLPQTCVGQEWGVLHGGGPPTIADFDGDGTPDVGTAGGRGYAVFNGAKLIDPNVAAAATLLWAKPTFDCSSASTGSAVFDFEGDGIAEVVYSDEHKLRVYAGPTGAVLHERCNTTATLSEYPVIADVDNDGQADIVAVSNASYVFQPKNQCVEDGKDRQAGVRVFGAAGGKWVRTRRVWNQHAYSITNVEEDGTIPAMPANNWAVPDLNNFRQNNQPDSELGAPDAIVKIEPLCVDDSYSLVATVRNVGEASLPAGVVVGLYTGEPGSGDKVATLITTKVLYPLETEALIFPFDAAPDDVQNGVVDIYAIVDDGNMPHPTWAECRTDNNTGTSTGRCLIPG